MHCGNMHFLPSAEVFSVFPIVTPTGRAPNKKATKISCLPLRPKDFLIFCFVCITYNTLLGFVKQSFIIIITSRNWDLHKRRRAFLLIGLLMIDYWVVGSENDEAGGRILDFRINTEADYDRTRAARVRHAPR